MRTYKIRRVAIVIEPELRERFNKHFPKGDTIKTTIPMFMMKVGLAQPNWLFCNDEENTFFCNLHKFSRGELNDDI
jgi:hypothetical protein